MILDRASPFIKIDAERRSGTLINDVLETLFPALFHAACALSAPSGHLPLEGKADDTRIPSSKMRQSRHLTLNLEPKSLSMTKKPEHASSVFWLFYWRLAAKPHRHFHFTLRRSTPESLATSRGLAMYRNMQEIRRRDGICASPRLPLPPPSSLRYNISNETLISQKEASLWKKYISTSARIPTTS